MIQTANAFAENGVLNRGRLLLHANREVRAALVGDTSTLTRQVDASEEGAALVEMALSSAVFLCALVGIFFLVLCLYSYDFVADAAREACRYASVRGSASVTNTPTLSNRGVTQAELQTWIRTLGYPGSNNLTATVTWLRATSSGTPATTTWVACTIPPCNAPGNLVQVQVTYMYPLGIPFWKTATVGLSSTSSMVIAQ